MTGTGACEFLGDYNHFTRKLAQHVVLISYPGISFENEKYPLSQPIIPLTESNRNLKIED